MWFIVISSIFLANTNKYLLGVIVIKNIEPTNFMSPVIFLSNLFVSDKLISLNFYVKSVIRFRNKRMEFVLWVYFALN